MAISRVVEVKSQLPHARIYLDDLRAIEDYIKVAVSKRSNIARVEFDYRLDGNRRATESTDLEKFVGLHEKFALIATFTVDLDGHIEHEREDQTILDFLGSGVSPRFHCPFDLEQDEFELFAKVEQLFEERRDQVRYAALKVPTGFLWILGTLVFGASFILSGYKVAGPAVTRSMQLGSFLFLLASGIALNLQNRTSGIYFFESHADERHKEARREKRRDQLWGAAFAAIPSAIIGALIKALIDKYSKGH